MSNPSSDGLAPGVYRPGDYKPPQYPLDGRTKVLSFSYRSAALFCYFPLCCCWLNVIASVLWLATEPKENRFVRFHALQGLLLAAVSFGVALVFRVLGAGARLSSFGPGSDLVGLGASFLIDIVAALFFIPILVIHIIAMVKAGQGETWKLPVIGNIAERNA
jgi:uncharacterized membrane protein